MSTTIRAPRLAAAAALAAALTLGACTGESPASVPHPSPQAPPAAPAGSSTLDGYIAGLADAAASEPMPTGLAELLAPDFGDITELAERSGP